MKLLDVKNPQLGPHGVPGKTFTIEISLKINHNVHLTHFLNFWIWRNMSSSRRWMFQHGASIPVQSCDPDEAFGREKSSARTTWLSWEDFHDCDFVLNKPQCSLSAIFEIWKILKSGATCLQVGAGRFSMAL
jgi:hypothetical protein